MAKGVAQKAAPVKAPMWIPVFLKSIGAPVNQHNAAFLASWWHREGGALTNNAKFNWLNTTHGKGFPSINSVGVKAYPNFQTGINQLKQVFSYYPNLTKSLQSGAVNLNDPGVQADLNKWLSGNAQPGKSSYIQGIESGMGAQPPFPASGVQNPQSGVPGRQKASGGLTGPSPAAPVTPQTFIAPNIGTLPGFVGAGEPLKNMPGIPKIGQVVLVHGPTKAGTQAPPLKVVYDHGVKPNAATNEVVDFAREYLGTKYVWGGNKPGGFDCSGFVQWIYGHMGINLPRTTYEQVHSGVAVNPKHLKAGDIVFFEPGPNGPGHEALYIGGGKVIQAPHTGDVVRITPLSKMGGIVAARRVR